MNMTTICASVDNETVRITKRPAVSSGGVQQCRVLFTFSDDWNDLTKAAIFADRAKKTFYQVLIGADGYATVPWEVLTEKGAFWMGAEGVSGDVKFTSELIRYPILEGAREGGATQPPTPGIYDEILDKIDILREDVDEMGDDVTDLQGDISALQGGASDLPDKVSALQGDVTDLQGNVSDLQGDVTDLQGNVSDLQGDVTGLQSDIGSMGSSVSAMDGRVSAAETDIDNIQDQIGQLDEKLDSMPEPSGGGLANIVRLDSFYNVYNITITAQESVNIDTQAEIYNGHDYLHFQHDFALPLVAGPQIEPYITEDKKHIALRLTASAVSAIGLNGLSDPVKMPETGSDGVPEYFRAHLEEKEEQIRQALIGAGRNRSAFIFLTDPHWDTNRGHSPALIRHIRAHTPVRTLFCGGDILPENGCSLQEAMEKGQAWQEVFRGLGDNSYCLPGDSDLNRGQNLTPPFPGQLSEKQLYSWLQADMDGRSVSFGKGLNFRLDNFAEKSRYVALDTGECMLSQNAADFLTESLGSLPEGWHCVILSHIYQTLSTAGDRNSVTDQQPAAKLLSSIIKGYQSRSAGTDSLGPVSVNYDFRKCKGEITAIIGGHLHFDSSTRTESGVPVIQTDCDGIGTLSETGAGAGTINEQALTVVIADYDQNRISCIRIGRGADLTLPITR